jgi:hypothetical protein
MSLQHPPALVAPAPENQGATLGGTLRGSYTITPGIPDTGTQYTLAGAGTLGHLGPVTAAGKVRTPGFIATGQATGTLTVSNPHGEVSLQLQGPPQPGFSPPPEQFQYMVQKATGMYAGLRSSGTVVLHLTPAPIGMGSPHGRFTLTIQPTPSTRTGIKGVAMEGPITPVSRPGVPNSQPLPNAVIMVEPAGGGKVITQVVADSQGRFQVLLPPGTYLLVPVAPKGQLVPRGISETVTVPAQGFAQVVVNYDTGIR